MLLASYPQFNGKLDDPPVPSSTVPILVRYRTVLTVYYLVHSKDYGETKLLLVARASSPDLPTSTLPTTTTGSPLLTVLIVDDSAVIRRTLRSSIEQNASLSVCGEAENGQIGVEKVKQLQPDTVILDLQMPIMNGLEAAKEISEIAPRTVMLMYTMYSSEQLAKVAEATGIQKVFSKSEGGPNELVAWLSNSLVRP